MSAFCEALRGNEIDLLLMLDVNPVYTAEGDVNVAQILRDFSRGSDRGAMHIGAYADETAALCAYHAPLSHPLESWGDLRAHDGTASIVQPLIEPLWQSRSAVEFMGSLLAVAAAKNPLPSGYDLVRAYWMNQWSEVPATDRERHWRQVLRDGVIPSTASRALTNLPATDVDAALRDLAALAPASQDSIELAFRPDPSLQDGFWANHPWLQELPKPISQVSWGNIAIMGAATARQLGLAVPTDAERVESPVVRIEAGGKAIEIPARVLATHPEGVVTLYLGGGRGDVSGNVQAGIGVNVNPLRTRAMSWHRVGSDVHVSTTSRHARVPGRQQWQMTSGRDVVRGRTVSSLPSPDAAGDSPDLNSTTQVSGKTVHLSLYPERSYPGYKWGMVIDLAACIGCNACVIACQAENNIPTVGPEQVWMGRDMLWLRIDTYHGEVAVGGEESVSFQPMLCQHCENAPCEVVCPVEATSHSREGINEMTYNRCVGTRYCSNNCPYKVRRFNFLHYTARDRNSPETLQKNPNVTVRSRGVMEKCTYCIQRINRARIEAKRDWVPGHAMPEMRVREREHGEADSMPRLEFQTACQQSCPTEAIIFGDLNDADALVTKLKYASPWRGINYGVLTELNTQPRTSYLERIGNPNPALAAPATAPGGAA